MPVYGSKPRKSKLATTPDSNAAIRQKAIALLRDDKDNPLAYGYESIPDYCVDTRLPSLNIYSGMDKDGGFGIPGASICCITGDSSQGKTSLGLNLVASAQEKGLIVYLIETEGLLSESYMQILGVNTKDILTPDKKRKPTTLQAAYNTIRDQLLKINSMPEDQRVPLFIFMDSMSALPTEEEAALDTLEETGSIGGHARANSKIMRILTPLIIATKSIFVLTTQAKQDIGFGKFAASKTFIGSRPIKFHSGLIYEIARTEWVKKNEEPVGMKCNIKVIKSKVGAPMRSAEDVIFDFATGFDKDLSLHSALVDVGLMKKQGDKFVFAGKVANGEELSYAKANGIKSLDPKVKAALEKALYNYVRKLRGNNE